MIDFESLFTEPLKEVDIDGFIDLKGIKYIGKAQLQLNGLWRCLANVGGACIVEAKIEISKMRKLYTEYLYREEIDV